MRRAIACLVLEQDSDDTGRKKRNISARNTIRKQQAPTTNQAGPDSNLTSTSCLNLD